MNQRQILERLPLQLLLPLLFFLIGLVYLYAAPNFEASDTVQHVGVVKWIADTGTLPVQSAEHGHIHGQEASQPPLYYLLMAAVWQMLDTADFEERFRQSPFGVVGDPLRLGNRNLILYKQPYPPDLRGASLALYVIRFLSLAMGAVTVGAVYQSARLVLPARKGVALLAAAFTAFNPQFLFISASVSNDTLVNMLAALITWQMLLMLRAGFQTRRSLLLALLIALATLTKLSGLVVGLVVGLAALWLLYRQRDWRGFFMLAGAAIAFTLLIAGWWYVRNLMLYGELLGTSTMLDNFGRRSTTLGRLFLEEFEGLRISYWAVFGAFNIIADKLYYTVMDGLALLGAAGFVLFLAKNRRAQSARLFLLHIFFLALLLVLGAALLMWWSLQTWASTGRLLFPYITSASLFLALGLRAWRLPPLLIAVPLGVFSLLAPFLYIMPNYDHPPTVAQLPATATSVTVDWVDLRLIGYELPPTQLWSAGAEIPLTLYWDSGPVTHRTYALALRLLDAQGQEIAGFDTFPGWGTLPNPWWQPEVIYQDDYIMQLPADAPSSADLRLYISWYEFPGGAHIPPTGADGAELAAFTLPLGALDRADS